MKVNKKFMDKLEVLKEYNKSSNEELLERIEEIKTFKQEGGKDKFIIYSGDSLELELEVLEAMYKTRLDESQEKFENFIESYQQKLRENTKLDRIQIRCTAAEKKEFSELAEARGMNTGEFLRALIKVYKGEVNKESLNVDINEGIDRVIKQLELLKIKWGDTER